MIYLVECAGVYLDELASLLSPKGGDNFFQTWVSEIPGFLNSPQRGSVFSAHQALSLFDSCCGTWAMCCLGRKKRGVSLGPDIWHSWGSTSSDPHTHLTSALNSRRDEFKHYRGAALGPTDRCFNCSAPWPWSRPVCAKECFSGYMQFSSNTVLFKC